MKKALFVFILIPLFSMMGAASVHANLLPAQDSLRLKGKTTFGDKVLPKVTVEVFTDSIKPFSQFESDSNGICSFALPLNNFFRIKFSKTGYVSKILTINTTTSDRLAGKYYLEFSVAMLEEIPKMDFSLFKKPVARIIFNSFTRNFEYDREYASKIRNEMKELYANYINLLENDNLPADSLQDSTTFSANFRIPVDSIRQPEVSKANAESKVKTVFSVQLIALSKPLKNYTQVFKGFGEVREYRHSVDHKYKYYVGNYKSIYDAQKLLFQTRKFFPHAFIIAFQNGTRVEMTEELKKDGKQPGAGEQ